MTRFRHRSWRLPGVAMIGCLLSMFAPAQPAGEADLDPRWRKLGILREELPPGKNPIVSMLALLEEVPADLRKEFSNGALARPFNRYKPTKHTVTQCAMIQTRARKIIARGPGQVPNQESTWLSSDTFLLWRVNSVLATNAFDRGLHATAAAHLAFNFELSDFILRSEPALMGFVLAHATHKRAYEDLFTLYLAKPTRDRLQQFVAIHRKARFRRSSLKLVLRGEARFSQGQLKNLPASLRENFEAAKESGLPSAYGGMTEPLGSCTTEDLLAMKYDLHATLAEFLVELEQIDRWISSGHPASRHPHFTVLKTKPKTLKYYNNAPNGLSEIFRDCDPSDPFLATSLSALVHDTFMDVALAWLSAEADGVKVTSLSSLVPKYLASLPLDPADGKPLRCLPAKRTIYSVDFDLRDDDGTPFPHLKNLEDLHKAPKTTDEVFVIPKVKD